MFSDFGLIDGAAVAQLVMQPFIPVPYSCMLNRLDQDTELLVKHFKSGVAFPSYAVLILHKLSCSHSTIQAVVYIEDM